GYDYHDWLTPRLEALATWFCDKTNIRYKAYVDTGAILERAHAQQAGLGFVGKNTMLIHPRRGSYFFIGEIVTDYVFEQYDEPHKPTLCGTCT
ncbi:MAG TPA: epoxyqueuosine reductase, partial [Aggregatilineales bacterium]|nr:epoxyqueuosine reductase [Aggregatilineales bacterium]